MTTTELIEALQWVEKTAGKPLEIVLDDLYTPACRPVDNVFIESKSADPDLPLVAIIRA